MEKLGSAWRWTTNFVVAHVPIISVVIGAFCIAFSVASTDPTVGEFGKTVGTTILAGGVFAGVAKSFLYTKFFEEAVYQVVYGDKFLKKRHDLRELWERVSSAVSQNKFADLTPSIHAAILDNYLDTEYDYYYKNYTNHAKAEWGNEEKTAAKLNITTRYTIVPKDAETNVKLTHTITHHMKAQKGYLKIDEFSVDKQDRRHEYLDPDDFLDVGEHKLLDVSLTGQTEYNVVRKISIAMDLLHDPTIKYQFPRYIMGAHVHINVVPEDLFASFESSGTFSNFEKYSDPEDGHRRDYRLTDLIFPNQGYVLTFGRYF